MRLTKKTLCYSVLISAVLMAFVVVYFCFMMPSLYVDYAKKDDLKSVVDEMCIRDRYCRIYGKYNRR